jgi:acetyltransferase-like isoleucine patch superfamily enzyme
MGILYRVYKISVIKTIYFNLKYLPFKQAIKLPVLISKKVYLKTSKGIIEINHSITFGMIKIGFGDVGIFDEKRSRTIWQIYGKVIFYGTANIGHGSKISVAKSGVLSLGNNFRITAESSIVVHLKIDFGSDCLLSWDTLVMDTDLHKIKNEFNIQVNCPSPINIGNSVWIGCRNLILKGAIIPDNSIIGANTLVNKELKHKNSIYVGNPVVRVKENVNWEL